MSGYSVEAILRATDKNFTSTMQAAQRSLGDIEGSVSRVAAVGQRIESVGKVMTAGLTLPLAAAGVAALRVGADFDESMTTVRARTGMAADGVDDLGKAFRDMATSGTYGSFTARQIAAAYAQVARYGDTAEHATSLLRSTQTLATATGMDLGDATRFLSDYLIKVGKDASYAERYINIFADANRRTGIPLEQLQQSLFRTNDVLNATNITGAEATAMFALLYEQGIKNAQAYSGLRYATRALLDPTEEQIAALNRLGIARVDENGKLLDGMTYMGKVTEALAGMSAEQQIYYANLLGSNDGGAAFLAGMVDIRAELPGMARELSAAGDAAEGTGVAFELAGIKQESLAAQARLLRSRLEEVGLQIAAQLIPRVIRLVDAASRLMNRFASLRPSTQRVAVAFGALAAAIGPTLIVVGRVTQAYANLKGKLIAFKSTQALATKAEKLRKAATLANEVAQHAAMKAERARGLTTMSHAQKQKYAIAAEKAQKEAILANKKAQIAQAGSTSALTKKLTLSKAAKIKAGIAMKTLNVAMKANPIGAVLTAAVALTAAVIGLVRYFRRLSDDSDSLSSRQRALRDSTNNLKNSMESSRNSFESNRQNMEANVSMVGSLTDKILELSAVENKSATQKAELRTKIGMLNNSVEGLNLQYDELTGTLNMSESALRSKTDAMMAQARASVYMERMKEVYREIYELTKKVAESEMQLVEARVQHEEAMEIALVSGGFHVSNLHEQEQAHKDLIEELARSQEHFDELSVSTAENSMVIEENAQAYEKASAVIQAELADKEAAYERFSQTMQERSEHIRAALEDLGGSYKDLRDVATDMFSQISDEMTMSVADMQANLEHNQRVIAEWADNIARLAEMGVDEGMLNTLREAGPASAGHVAAMVAACETEVMKLSNTFAEGGQTAVDALATSLGIDTSVARYAAQLAESAEESLRSRLDAAGFDVIGKGIGEGLATGITSGSPNAANAAESMASMCEDAVRAILMSNSPSMLMHEIGVGVPEGLANGIESNASSAVSAMESLAESIVSALESGISQLDSISTVSFSGIASAARAGMSQMASAITSGLSSSVSAKTAGMRNMSTAVQVSMTAMQNKVRTGMTQITQAITQGTTQMNNAVRSNFQIMQSTTLASMTAINNAVRINTQTMQTTTTASMTAMNNTVRTNTQAMQTSTSASMIALSNSVTTGMNGARNSVASAAAGMSASVNTLQGSFRAAGANAAFGLAAGINANRGAAIGAAQSLANAVSSTMRSALAIRSPSRVMKAIGGYTADGFILGMLEKMQAVKSIANEMAEAIMPQNLYDEKLAFAGANFSITDDISFDTNHTVNVPVYLDARQVAKVTAKYNLHEQNLIEDRSNKRRR